MINLYITKKIVFIKTLQFWYNISKILKKKTFIDELF